MTHQRQYRVDQPAFLRRPDNDIRDGVKLRWAGSNRHPSSGPRHHIDVIALVAGSRDLLTRNAECAREHFKRRPFGRARGRELAESGMRARDIEALDKMCL